MLTIDGLRNFGANVEEGLTRCMNREDFYLMLVGKAVQDDKLTKLEQQLAEKDLKGAFETAHALKGMYANLSLTPLSNPINQMTELLRTETDTDYFSLLEEAKTNFRKLCELSQK